MGLFCNVEIKKNVVNETGNNFADGISDIAFMFIKLLRRGVRYESIDSD